MRWMFWQGVFLQAATPDAIVLKLASELQAAAKQLGENNLLQDAGFVANYLSPTQTLTKICNDLTTYRSIAREAKIVIE